MDAAKMKTKIIATFSTCYKRLTKGLYIRDICNIGDIK